MSFLSVFAILVIYALRNIPIVIMPLLAMSVITGLLTAVRLNNEQINNTTSKPDDRCAFNRGMVIGSIALLLIDWVLSFCNFPHSTSIIGLTSLITMLLGIANICCMIYQNRK